MEQTNTNAAGNIMANPKSTNGNPPRHDQEHGSDHKKKSGSKNIFKVALFMMRRSNVKKSITVQEDGGSSNKWKKVVGSMRPLHLQSNQSPQHNNPRQLPKVASAPEIHDHSASEEVFDSIPNTPHHRSASCSRYASAVGLNELVNDEEIQNTIEEDEMIDAKAEEFIANFYKQMKMQHMDANEKFSNSQD